MEIKKYIANLVLFLEKHDMVIVVAMKMTKVIRDTNNVLDFKIE